MRTCGDCTLCCTLCHVPELGKVEGEFCAHCLAGCAIYDTRPSSCQEYACAWLQGLVPEFMRPDKCGAMVEVFPKMVAVLVAPNFRLADLSDEVLTVLDEFVEGGLPVISTGQFARLPAGMSGAEAKKILIDTVKEYRNGGVVQH